MSIFVKSFRYQISINSQYLSDVESYCQREIGDQTYWINGFYGGQHWRITRQFRGLYSNYPSEIVVELNDKDHAMLLALKYS